MGAWGTGSFENDDAQDFLVMLESEGPTALTVALEDMTDLDAQDYLGAPEASSAIAAAEVVAAAHDGEAARLPDSTQEFLDRHRDSIVALHLLALARRAVERVLTQSELKDMREEGGANAQSEAWASGVRELLRRLEAKASPAARAKPSKKPRARKVAIGPGAVLRVDLDDQWHTYARILARIPKVAFYDCRVATPVEDLLTVTKSPVLFVLAVGGAHDGHWPKVGDVSLDAAPVRIPDQFMQDVGTGKCTIADETFNVRSATPEECAGLEAVAVWNTTHVEERLRDHCAGRPNANLEHMKVKLVGSRWHTPRHGS